MALIDDLHRYHEGEGILATQFTCQHKAECRGGSPSFTGPNSAFVGERYEDAHRFGLPCLLFVSLDCRGQDARAPGRMPVPAVEVAFTLRECIGIIDAEGSMKTQRSAPCPPDGPVSAPDVPNAGAFPPGFAGPPRRAADVLRATAARPPGGRAGRRVRHGVPPRDDTMPEGAMRASFLRSRRRSSPASRHRVLRPTAPSPRRRRTGVPDSWTSPRPSGCAIRFRMPARWIWKDSGWRRTAEGWRWPTSTRTARWSSTSRTETARPAGCSGGTDNGSCASRTTRASSRPKSTVPGTSSISTRTAKRTSSRFTPGEFRRSATRATADSGRLPARSGTRRAEPSVRCPRPTTTATATWTCSSATGADR